MESGEDEINDGDECGAEGGADEVVLRGQSIRVRWGHLELGSRMDSAEGSGLEGG